MFNYRPLNCSVLKRIATLHTEFREGKVNRATIGADEETSTAFKTEFGIRRIFGLALWATHFYPIPG